ncbi:hypothetical protein PYS58_00560 [Chryseobacterium indologenes]|uniref:hypothetical protein n=1 Tax=Chryseobacterium indologenes TaxID=253 RepID=UPI0023E8BD40|nr:hypothetical protein [Chryseobacterium indologenes]WET49632.1 hypothetical protein PYS58_00560 [Chryseobacterium indologenes]
MKINTALVLLCSQLMIVSCKKDEKTQGQNQPAIVKDSVKTATTEDEIDFKNFHIFNVSTMQRKELMDTFISVSNIYNDKNAVPADFLKKQKELPFDKVSYIELDGTYRKKMLDGIHITENDSLYLYNYETNKLQKIPVNTLKAVAYLSPYTVEGDEVDSDSYMLGFQVDTQKGTDIFDKYMNVLAYFGSKSPFVENQMKMIKWEKAGTDIQKKYFPGSTLKYGGTYQYKYENLIYYVQDFLEEYGTQERKLVVINDHNEKIFEKTFTIEDGAEFNPLEKTGNEETHYYAQWTGNLFQGKAPVVFNFTAPSFGCPAITFLDKEKTELSINCDNRH